MGASSGRLWNDRSLRTKGLVIVLAPLLVLLVLGPVVLIALRASERASSTEVRDARTELAASRVLQGVVDAETGVRGYLLTHDYTFLEPYHQARDQLLFDRVDLRLLMDTDPERLTSDELQPTIDARLALLQTVVLNGSASPAQLEHGRRLTEQIRRGIEGIVAAEHRDVEVARAERDTAQRRATLAATIAIPAGLLAGVALTIAFTRGITRRVERNTVNAERLATGRDLLPPPAGKDEIGRSGAALIVAAAELTATHADLARSNTELEQFAYVASHDLQEPLRMIAGHLQVLELDLEETLAEESAESLHFAVDGAKRMQTMINDLLTYSRVGSQGEESEPVDLETPLGEALRNLDVALCESEGSVTHGDLPVVEADPRQLTQLFQNLVGNALKYRADEPPLVHIGAERRNGEWVVSVTDNGIGIPPEQSERVFKIFQRLHNRDRYEGTGIGLAVCRRIVERHHGHIWVESEPGCGSIFRFTLPATSRGKA